MAISPVSGGSSPLARGTPLPTTGFARLKPVHPRWRGEHAPWAPKHVHSSGSSPLARGTLGRDLGAHEMQRFIPAGAGNTPPR